MTNADQQFLLNRLDAARAQVEELLPQLPRQEEIYSGWTIKDLLAHLTGWDEALIDTFRAHVSGQPPKTPADRCIDEYNSRMVASRSDLDFLHVLQEWKLTRQILRTIFEQMPEEEFLQPFTTPWGEQGSVTTVLGIIREHEEQHAQGLRAWLLNPAKPH